MKDSTDNPEVIIQKKKWIKPVFYILDEATIESGLMLVSWKLAMAFLFRSPIF